MELKAITKACPEHTAIFLRLFKENALENRRPSTEKFGLFDSLVESFPKYTSIFTDVPVEELSKPQEQSTESRSENTHVF